jgi:hypothetical protein
MLQVLQVIHAMSLWDTDYTGAQLQPHHLLLYMHECVYV